jgi:ferredoxin
MDESDGPLQCIGRRSSGPHRGRTLAVKAREGGKSVAKKPLVDKDECISCGICKNNCPQVFRFDARGKAECYDPNGAPEEVIQRDAIDLCPVSCISWVE